MTRLLKSAKGSESNGWNSMPADQPRDCYRCGRPIRISREDCGFSTFLKRSWHFVCPETV